MKNSVKIQNVLQNFSRRDPRVIVQPDDQSTLENEDGEERWTDTSWFREYDDLFSWFPGPWTDLRVTEKATWKDIWQVNDSGWLKGFSLLLLCRLRGWTLCDGGRGGESLCWDGFVDDKEPNPSGRKKFKNVFTYWLLVVAIWSIVVLYVEHRVQIVFSRVLEK